MSKTDRTIAAGGAESANDSCNGKDVPGVESGVALKRDFANRHVCVFGGTTGSFRRRRDFRLAGRKLQVGKRRRGRELLAAAGGKVIQVVADARDIAAVSRTFEAACTQFRNNNFLVSGAVEYFLTPFNRRRMVFVLSWTSI